MSHRAAIAVTACFIVERRTVESRAIPGCR
jgi:hypothetical protein